MKTKVLKVIGIVTCLVAALFVNANIETNKGTKDVDLTKLVTTTEANAECIPAGFKELNNGRCSLMNNCFWDPNSKNADCDYTRS